MAGMSPYHQIGDIALDPRCDEASFFDEIADQKPAVLTEMTSMPYQYTDMQNNFCDLTNYNPDVQWRADDWRSAHPEHWDCMTTMEWLHETAAIYQFDNSIFQSERFRHLNGRHLCEMSKQQFITLEPTYGEKIYHAFRESQFPNYSPQFAEVPQPDTFCYSYDDKDMFPSLGSMTVEPLPSITCLSGILNGAEFAALDSSSPDADLPPSPTSDISTDSHYTPNEAKKDNIKKVGNHLWEFILELLNDPKCCPSIIKWEDREQGVFKIVKSEKVAKLWGEKKNNKSMTYEKMSRAMRYYYKRQILDRIDGRRLVYKFGAMSNGWQL